MERYIGLDVHCKESVYVAQDVEGRVVREGAVEATEEGLRAMVEEVGAPAGTKVGLETGTQATWVARTLERLGMKPVVIDAHEVRAKARRVGLLRSAGKRQPPCGLTSRHQGGRLRAVVLTTLCRPIAWPVGSVPKASRANPVGTRSARAVAAKTTWPFSTSPAHSTASFARTGRFARPLKDPM